MLKRAYVGAVRGARVVAGGLGLLDWLERRRQHRPLLWARSLFAIWDVADLIRLDLPWWTFEAAALVERFLNATPGARVFEWGSGASTVWLARRAGWVVTVEHDAAWAGVLAPHLDALRNVACQLRPPRPAAAPAPRSAKAGWTGMDFSAYVDAIAEAGGRFDLIVIDGRCRAACLARAPAHLAEPGLIVFDNSERRRYRTGIEGCGLARIETRGLTACLPYPGQTTLLTPSPRALELIGRRPRPPVP